MSREKKNETDCDQPKYLSSASANDRYKNGQIWQKNVKIVEFHDHIWNHHKKCLQISTNMPSFGLIIPEITCEMLEF